MRTAFHHWEQFLGKSAMFRKCGSTLHLLLPLLRGHIAKAPSISIKFGISQLLLRFRKIKLSLYITNTDLIIIFTALIKNTFDSWKAVTWLNLIFVLIVTFTLRHILHNGQINYPHYQSQA